MNYNCTLYWTVYLVFEEILSISLFKIDYYGCLLVLSLPNESFLYVALGLTVDVADLQTDYKF